MCECANEGESVCMCVCLSVCVSVSVCVRVFAHARAISLLLRFLTTIKQLWINNLISIEIQL